MGANISSSSSHLEPKPRPTFRGISDRKDHDKKKKSSKLQTFKKKLVRARRHSRSYDYCKLIRDYTSNWTVEELSSLVDDYDSSLILKELSALADGARPQPKNLKEDLAQLFDDQICTDVKLIYKNICYPVHRAIVCVRCGYFRELLKKHPEPQSEIIVEIKTQGVTQHLFRSVLRYLYTGEFNRCDNPGTNGILMSLCQEFGTPNILEHDLRYLLETSEYCDTILVFSTSDEDENLQPTNSSCDESSLLPNNEVKKLELPCHKALLCARSRFFRSIFSRKSSTTSTTKIEPILLDESVIPRQYARVLLHCLYLDVVDLTCVVRSCGSTNSLSEVQAMVTGTTAGKGRPAHCDDAMDIYLIGRFVDFPSLSQGCEDLIVDSLSVETLTPILTWSSRPYGSDWVHRQALQYLNDEFQSLASAGALSTLPDQYLLQCVQSDFVQACEVDILAAVLKWGEDRLIKRIEEREPNLLAHTAHSVSKKGVKKRDLNDSELRAILAGFMPYIRTEHVIPASHELLLSCIKRGLISTPPSHMMADEGSIKRHHVWIRNNRSGIYTKPRAFLPFYEEFKTILKEQLSQLPALSRRPSQTPALSPIPDTLYMVSDTSPYHSPGPARWDGGHAPYNSPAMTSHDDYGAGSFSMPDKETLTLLLQRELELLQTPSVQKAFRNPLADKRSIRHLIQLCTVRELGLPDATVQVFRGVHDSRQKLNPRPKRSSRYSRQESISTTDSHRASSSRNDSSRTMESSSSRTLDRTLERSRGSPKEYLSKDYSSRTLTPGGYRTEEYREQGSYVRRRREGRTTREEGYRPEGYREDVRTPQEEEMGATAAEPAGLCDLSDLVPDIAMSAPSGGSPPRNGEGQMARLSLNEEMDLDLVDGTRKTMSVYI